MNIWEMKDTGKVLVIRASAVQEIIDMGSREVFADVRVNGESVAFMGDIIRVKNHTDRITLDNGSYTGVYVDTVIYEVNGGVLNVMFDHYNENNWIQNGTIPAKCGLIGDPIPVVFGQRENETIYQGVGTPERSFHDRN